MNAVCLGCGERVSATEPCACAALGASPYREAEVVPHGGCPRCTGLLVAEDYADTPLDECVSCAGIFVEGWILDRLVAARDARISLAISLPARPLHREAAVRYLKCPRCSTQMNRKIFGRSSGVVVDVCKQHGMWFDSGELAAVIEFIESGRFERAKQREQQEKADEARRLRGQRVGAISGEAPDSLRVDLAGEFVRALVEWWKA